MITDLSTLKQFREALYAILPKRKDAIFNLLDAVSSYGHRCKSVIELSTAACFERHYSSITDAIADGLKFVDWDTVTKLIADYSNNTNSSSTYRFLLDCTPNPRPYAKKLVDRSIIHKPNPAPGNKPIDVGHQYSVLAQLPEEDKHYNQHWLIPLMADLVNSQEKGNEVGMRQLNNHIRKALKQDDLAISIGDSLYGTENCRIAASSQHNLVHIFRLNSKRKVFKQVMEADASQSKLGRKKVFGKKMTLNKPQDHDEHDQAKVINFTTKHGRQCKAIIQCWNNMLLRGSKKFKSEKHPINLVKVQILDDAEKPVFKRPLWLGIFGQRRNEIAPEEVYRNYRARYDIEHFFRFGKQKLLTTAYQTPDVNHEQNWWRLCMTAYFQLYLAKSLSKATANPWEKYLPIYKKQTEYKASTPSQAQRGFSNLLRQIGTPAIKPIPRGNPCGRMAGMTQQKRAMQPIIFKGKNSKQNDGEGISSGFEQDANNSNLQKIQNLAEIVQQELAKQKMTVDEFIKLLENSS